MAGTRHVVSFYIKDIYIVKYYQYFQVTDDKGYRSLLMVEEIMFHI